MKVYIFRDDTVWRFKQGIARATYERDAFRGSDFYITILDDGQNKLGNKEKIDLTVDAMDWQKIVNISEDGRKFSASYVEYEAGERRRRTDKGLGDYTVEWVEGIDQVSKKTTHLVVDVRNSYEAFDALVSEGIGQFDVPVLEELHVMFGEGTMGSRDLAKALDLIDTLTYFNIDGTARL